MNSRILIGAIAAGALCLAAPSAASAAVSCSFSSGTHEVTVTATGDQDKLGLVVVPGTDPAVIATDPDPEDPFGDTPAPVACGAANTDNTDTVIVNDNSPSDSADIQIDMRGGRFAPGFTDEGLFNSDEIEFRINTSSSGQNWLTIWGTESDDGVSAGKDGITLNAQSEQGLNSNDIDVTNAAGTAFPAIGGGTLFRVNLVGGDDAVKADGSDDTGAAIDDYDGIFSGGNGDDELIGADGDRNVLNPGIGDDFVDGKGAATNVLIMGQSNPGVVVDLSKTTPQDTIGAGVDTILHMDNVQGTDSADEITGSDGPNQIDGLGGADVIRGRLGDDELNGSLANANPPHQGDTVAYDKVIAFGGQGVDLTAGTSGGGQGSDTLTGFDNITGSALGDDLIGDDLANTIVGGEGEDDIGGQGGADTLRAADGIKDEVDCGTDAVVDNVFHDIGIDLLTNCGGDNLNLPAPPPPSPPAPPASAPAITKPCKKAKKKKKKKKKRAASAKKKRKKCKKKKGGKKQRR